MNKLAIIGVGNLGSSLARLMVINGYGNNLTISDKNHDLNIMKSGLWTASTKNNIETSDIIFIATKPNSIGDVLNEIKSHGNENKLIISTAAAVSIDHIETKLESDNYPIIRMMPNLPISTGKGSLTYIANRNVNSNLIHDMKMVLKGPTIMEVADEKLIDVSTIFTASMPAYISHMATSCITFGIQNGFTAEQSVELYTATLTGTADMLKRNDPLNIINNVATPNGVTRQGINHMELTNINENILESMNVSYNHLKSIKNH